MEMKKKSGFTLLELLMVVALIGLILVAITQILGATLAGSNKSQGLQVVKQNGQFAISTMSRLLRQSSSVMTCGNGMLEFIVPESGTNTTYRFDVNSNRLRKTVNGTIVSWVTDSSVATPAFNCILIAAAAGNPPVVNLNLTVSKPGLTVEDLISPTSFEVDISLRNY